MQCNFVAHFKIPRHLLNLFYFYYPINAFSSPFDTPFTLDFFLPNLVAKVLSNYELRLIFSLIPSKLQNADYSKFDNLPTSPDSAQNVSNVSVDVLWKKICNIYKTLVITGSNVDIVNHILLKEIN